MAKNPPAMWEPGFDPWVGKIPWRRERLPTPVFLPGESCGRKSLGSYTPRGDKRWTRLRDCTEGLEVDLPTNGLRCCRSGPGEALSRRARSRRRGSPLSASPREGVLLRTTPNPHHPHPPTAPPPEAVTRGHLNLGAQTLSPGQECPRGGLFSARPLGRLTIPTLPRS